MADQQSDFIGKKRAKKSSKKIKKMLAKDSDCGIIYEHAER